MCKMDLYEMLQNFEVYLGQMQNTAHSNFKNDCRNPITSTLPAVFRSCFIYLCMELIHKFEGKSIHCEC